MGGGEKKKKNRMSKALIVAIALALGVRRGAEAACTPCRDACASDGFKLVEEPKDMKGKCLCDIGGGVQGPPKSYKCGGDCCSRILGDGEVGTTGFVPTTKSAAATPSAPSSAMHESCEVCVANCATINNYFVNGEPDPKYCSHCFGHDCRSVCEEQHGKVPLQYYIDGGCKNNEEQKDYKESPRGSSCGDSCHHEVYGDKCTFGTWGGGQYFKQVCINGVNYAQHFIDASCNGPVVNEWEEKGCHPYGSEKDKHGNQVFESKWCDGSTPMKSLCVKTSVESKCGSAHNPDDNDCCAPNGEQMYCHDGWVPKRNGVPCGSYLDGRFIEDPNGGFDCYPPNQDERAKYCGDGTVWKGEVDGCVATYEGAVRACEIHRGKDWEHTCKPLNTCDKDDDEENHLDQYRCHGDDLDGLREDSENNVQFCDAKMCRKEAFLEMGAPEHWYQMKCCSTCKFSPAEDMWGADLYTECAKTYCPSAHDYFVLDPAGIAIVSNPLWSHNLEYVESMMKKYPRAREAVECACMHCGVSLNKDIWQVGEAVCPRVLNTYGNSAPSSSPNYYNSNNYPHRRRANTQYGHRAHW